MLPPAVSGSVVDLMHPMPPDTASEVPMCRRAALARQPSPTLLTCITRVGRGKCINVRDRPGEPVGRASSTRVSMTAHLSPTLCSVSSNGRLSGVWRAKLGWSFAVDKGPWILTAHLVTTWWWCFVDLRWSRSVWVFVGFVVAGHGS